MKNKTGKKSIGKILAIVVVLIIVIAGALWAKDYYNKRYVLADIFYTQIPLDEINEDSWLLNDEGQQVDEGKKYELKGFNEEGEERIVHFFARGKAEDYYEPGSFIRVEVSQTIEIGESIVQENEVPQAALEQIREKGTRID